MRFLGWVLAFVCAALSGYSEEGAGGPKEVPIEKHEQPSAVPS